MKRLWNNSFVFKFFLSYLAIIALLFTSFYFYSNRILRDLFISSLGARIEREAALLAKTLPLGVEGDALDALTRNLSTELEARLTIISPRGRVLGDSAEASSSMENHETRPEVMEAITSGAGSSIRYSTTLGHDLLYRAILYGKGSEKRVVRVSVPLAEIEHGARALARSLFIGMLAVSALGLTIALIFSRYLSRRLRRLVKFSHQVADGGSPQNFFPTGKHDEITFLEQRLNEMSEKIRDNIQQIVLEREKANSILRCMIEGVLVVDLKGRVLVINEQAKKMFQVPLGREVHGSSIAELSRHPEIIRIMQEVLEFDFEHLRYSKEIELDEGRWFRVNASDLRSESQEASGLILVFHDISEIKRIETARTDFVANVSHELRTPLTAIRGYVETLIQTPPRDPKEASNFLEIIERHSERLSRLIDDLLTLSDLESGKLSMARQPVNVTQVALRVLEVFSDQARKKGLKLHHTIEPGLPPLIGDFDRLQQLFINLVDNAVKYTPRDGVVTLKAFRLPDPVKGLAMVQVSVSDTGCGIPESNIPRLTERFYRVDKARSRELGGTGLGLAIVKHIVQAHQGTLRIESTAQVGTTVDVLLPAHEQRRDVEDILFLCSGNSCRSQMAEGFARHKSGDEYRIFSAGTVPKGIHPLAVKVMKEVGIDISEQRSKGLEAVPMDEIDILITLCGDAAETCPVIDRQLKRLHWPLPDPAGTEGDEEQILNVFREVRDAIGARVAQLLMASGRNIS